MTADKPFTERFRMAEAAHKAFIHSGGLTRRFDPKRWYYIIGEMEKVRKQGTHQ